MLFALCFPAGAQQPKKVPRIGFWGNLLPLKRPVWRIGKDYAISAMLREKT